MKLQIKNIGAIKNGTIDLSKKLNVFCGPNGTGKTYMSYIIYAITRLNNKSIGIKLEQTILKNALTENTFQIKIESETLFNYRAKEIEKIKNNLWMLFSVPQDKADSYFSETEINCLELEEQFNEQILNLELKDEDFKIYNYTFEISKISGSNELSIKLGNNIVKDESFPQFMEIVFLSRLYAYISFRPITSSTIFPVERNSIYTFVKELSIKRNEKIEQIESNLDKNSNSVFDVLFKRSTRYPQPIRDGLQVAEDLENMQKTTSKYSQFAEEIESQLLHGKVKITKEGGSVEFVSSKAPKKNLSFHQSSSIVKTLASLVIYLKHEAQHNDLVIIDEPELNLHPDNQVKLARIFARMINKGLRLIISTHSDYFVREFNNLVMVASNKPGIKEYAIKAGYLPDEYIDQNDIGAYIFDYKSKKEKQCDVTQVNILETGFDIPSVDKTIEIQNNNAEELFYTIKYGIKDEQFV